MRLERQYLIDIIEAADAIAAFLSGQDKQSFLDNDLVRSAVLHKITVIGEAAGKVTPEFRQRYSEVRWVDIVAFRNIAVHAYFSVEWSTVWVAATKETVELRNKIATILTAEFPDSEA